MQVSFFLPDDYPVGELQRLERELDQLDAIVAGYVSPDAGTLNFMALAYQRNIEGLDIQILPDLNIVLRLARAANGDIKFDRPSKIAFRLAAFAHLTDLQIDPSIAIHELASQRGHDEALKLLRDFRASDNATAEQWVDLANDKERTLTVTKKEAHVPGDLSLPLNRWKRNRLAILKIASLELDEGLSRRQKIEIFIDWLLNDYFVAGPAAIFATMYFAPRSPKSGLIKRLRSQDRRNAFKGIANESWDLTHLSEFGKKAVGGASSSHRYLFASADQKLCAFARLMLHEDEGSMRGAIQKVLLPWWDEGAATVISDLMLEAVADARTRTTPPLDSKGPEWLENETKRLEEIIEAWRPG